VTYVVSMAQNINEAKEKKAMSFIKKNGVEQPFASEVSQRGGKTATCVEDQLKRVVGTPKSTTHRGKEKSKTSQTPRTSGKKGSHKC